MNFLNRLTQQWSFRISNEPQQACMSISKEIIRRYMPSRPTIIEAGAHIGIDTIEMARLWSDATIYGFEPVPVLFKKLQRRTKKYRNVSVHPFALAESSGKRTMFLSEGASDASSSLLLPKDHLNVHPAVIFKNTVDVNTITLDQFCADMELKKVDMLWLDLQGYELPAMLGGARMIADVSAIHIEVNFSENYAGCALYPEVKDWLENQGFKVAIEKIVFKDCSNVLFCNERFNRLEQ